MPAFSRTRALAKTAVCGNNLRQIGIAFHLYLDDHNDLFPPGGGEPSGSNVGDASWEKYLYTYLDDKNVFICPVITKIGAVYEAEDGGTAPSATETGVHYGYNGYIGMGDVVQGRQPACLPLMITQVKAPSTTILCADALTYDYSGGSYSPGTGCFAGFEVDYRHLNGANILFVSGAAKWFDENTIKDNIVNSTSGSWWGWGGWPPR